MSLELTLHSDLVSEQYVPRDTSAYIVASKKRMITKKDKSPKLIYLPTTS